MDLRGNLAVFGPISVLQLISLQSSTGELTLESGINTARVYFDEGNVTFAEIANRRMRLGEYLVQEGLLARGHLNRALEIKDDGRRLGSILVEIGAIDAVSLRRAIEEQIKEVMYELVRWKTGRFKFTNQRRPKKQDILIDIPLDHLILEGLKRLDEEGVAR
ncbi:MAG TPA: DUF4388 domain-containing protein [Candidatus Krumholzibacteria bacterium]|nr:DUF4388 domain-containing protein [Candidatus Krumholzibacteria bacterium]